VLLAANKWPFRLHATYDESIARFLNGNRSQVREARQAEMLPQEHITF